MELTSAKSPRITAVRRLLRRSVRESLRQFLAEGPQAVREALDIAPGSPGGVRELFVTGEFEVRHGELLERARARGIEPVHVRGDALASLTETVTPQGVVAVCDVLDVPLAEVLRTSPSRVAVLAAVRDPGNAGTVIRTADASGADAVIVSDASVDVYNGKCVRATAGSLWHVPIVTGVPVPEAVHALRSAGLRVLAADGAAPRDLDDLADAGSLAGPTAWLFGNEAWGLPDNALGLADEAVRVPLYGRAESLNLATAAAVCLYASARAQRPRSGAAGSSG